MSPQPHSVPGSVLFVGINYAPEPTGVSPYTTGMAEGLAREGWDVRVITSYPHYPWWRTPDEFRGLPAEATVSGVKVRRVRHYVPRVPSTIKRALFEVSFGARALMCRWDDPDAVVVVSPALLASRLIALRARMRRIPVVTWVQDIYALGVQEAGGGTGAGAIGAVEAGLLAASERVVVIHRRFRAALEQQLGVTRPIDVVRNWSHVPETAPHDPADTRRRLGWREDEIVVLHTGAIGAKQGLENVVEAAVIARAQGSRVRFVLVGDGGQRAALQQREGADAVTFIDPLPEADYLQALAAADVLLVNERPGLTEMSVPSKLTSYFAAGRPVLAAVDTTSTTFAEMEAAGAGPIVPAAAPAALVTAAEQLAADPQRAARYGAAAQSYRRRILTEEAAVAAFSRSLGAAIASVRSTVRRTSSPARPGGSTTTLSARRAPS
ncbi:glycosyltransferase family 4 protein [Microbacterium oleivorans]|uniref:D-inositol 3-phosphate glycosyltransferase n=1 Tax=Microbacterium oleivorans TaxID=273677 RepID=A0A7D5JZG6_9MICO|nr:glycosyltransferase family 4 protein [Microbacterium oleivorans]QLD12323.1 glycosyltransferase family 4 protein [Microbacterium oleivorans]